MAPHIEVRSQTDWKVVPGTMHLTGDISSDEAIKAHNLLTEDSEDYREVPDFKGRQCKNVDKSKNTIFTGIHLFQKKKG